MKKNIICVLLIVACLSTYTTNVYAAWVYENGKMIYTDDEMYTENGKIKVYCMYERDYSDHIITIELPNVKLPSFEFIGADGKFVDGIIEYPNMDEMDVGFFNLQWVFIPNDDNYETITGYLKYEVFPEDDEVSKGKILLENEITEDLTMITTTTLTATDILLGIKSTYDININNKITGSKYKWTSSNPKVAKVNSKNGLVTAVSDGEALITCKITLPDGSVKTLMSKVVVGYDENSPMLTDAMLDLEVGDKYDINVENKIAKSKYRWTSSNRNVVKVNASNGKLTATGVGEAYITCTITTPANQIIVLRCDIDVTE